MWLALRPCRETGVGMGQGYRLEKSSLRSSQSPNISRLRTLNLQVTRWDMEKGMYVTIQQGTVNVELQAHRQALGQVVLVLYAEDWNQGPVHAGQTLCSRGIPWTCLPLSFLSLYVCAFETGSRYVAQADLKLLCSSYSCNSRDYRCTTTPGRAGRAGRAGCKNQSC